MALPLRSLSRVTGYLCSMELPRSLRSHIYKAYSWYFGCDLFEIGCDLSEYKSLSEFFSRSLEPGRRKISDGYSLVSLEEL